MRQSLILVMILAAAARAQITDAATPARPAGNGALQLPFPQKAEPDPLFNWFVAAKSDAALTISAARERRDANEVARMLARFDQARSHAVTELRRLRGDFGPPPPPAVLAPSPVLVLPPPGSAPGLPAPAAPEKKSAY